MTIIASAAVLVRVAGHRDFINTRSPLLHYCNLQIVSGVMTVDKFASFVLNPYASAQAAPPDITAVARVYLHGTEISIDQFSVASLTQNMVRCNDSGVRSSCESESLRRPLALRVVEGPPASSLRDQLRFVKIAGLGLPAGASVPAAQYTSLAPRTPTIVMPQLCSP